MLFIKSQKLIISLFILLLVIVTGCEDIATTLDPEQNKNRGLFNEGLKYYQSDNTKNKIIGLRDYFAKASDNKSLGYIVKALDDKNSQVRMAAMTVLVERQEADSVEYLVKKLSDNDSKVVSEAQSLIKDLGFEVSPMLIKQITNTNLTFMDKINTIKAMGLVRDQRFTDTLGRIVIDDRDFRLRIQAIKSISRINSPDANLYVYKGLVDRVPKVRIAALESIKKDRGIKLINYVSPLLNDKDENVVIQAIDTLAKNKNPDAIKPLIKKLVESEGSNKVIDQITKALSKLGTNESVDVYLDSLNDPKQFVRFTITKAAADAPPSYWTEQVIIKAAQNDDPEIKSMALFALRRTDSRDSVSAIIQSLNDYNGSVRLSAVKSLSKLPEASDYKDKFVILLDDPDFKVRIATIQAISNIEADWVFDVLTEVIDAHPDENMVLGAITALSESKNKNEAVRYLSRVTKNQNDKYSYAACNALITIGGPLVRKELLKNLKSSSSRVKINSLDALEKLGDSAAIGAIQRIKNDPDPEVQKQVAQTLHVLSLKKSIRKTKIYKYAKDIK